MTRGRVIKFRSGPMDGRKFHREDGFMEMVDRDSPFLHVPRPQLVNVGIPPLGEIGGSVEDEFGLYDPYIGIMVRKEGSQYKHLIMLEMPMVKVSPTEITNQHMAVFHKPISLQGVYFLGMILMDMGGDEPDIVAVSEEENGVLMEGSVFVGPGDFVVAMT